MEHENSFCAVRGGWCGALLALRPISGGHTAAVVRWMGRFWPPL